MADMISRQKLLQSGPAIERYVAAVLAVVCTLAIRLVLDPMLADRAPYIFFFLTIVIVTRFWGRGPGLLATALGGIAAWYFIIQPRFSFAFVNRFDAFNLAAYFAVGFGISFLGRMAGRAPSSPAGGRGIIKRRVIRHTAVLGGAAVVLAGMVLLLERDFKRAQDAGGWVAHSYRVMNSTQSLISMMKDAESGERGYLLTGDETYLAPYNSGIAALPRGLQELQDLTSDNPSQQARWAEINRLTSERLRVLKHAIELRRSSEADAALALVRYGRGEPAMEKLRSTLDGVMSEERRLLAQRTAKAAVEDSRERWVLGLGSGALIVLLVFASVVIERETTRREEITQALRRHADLVDQAHDCLFTWPLGGAINYWSRGAETLLGYTWEEAVGRSSHELLQTHHPLGMAQIDAMLERDGGWKGELTQTTKDGRKLTMEAQWTLAVDADGNKTVLEANRDITERKRATEQIRQLANEQRAILNTLTMGISYVKTRVQQWVNPAFATIFGYEAGEMQGVATARFYASPEDYERVGRDGYAQLAQGEVYWTEALMKKKSGALIWCSLSGQAINPGNPDGGSIWVLNDITERKRAQAENVLLATAIEQAEETVVITGRDAKIQYVNPAFTRTTGYSRDEALGQNPRVIKSGRHDDKFYQELWATLTAGKLWQGEFTNRRKDGTVFVEEATIAPVRDASGEITNYIAIKYDITERKQAEDALKQSEYLLRESQRVGRIGSYDLDITSGQWSSSAVLDEIFGIGKDHARDVNGWLALIRPGQREEMAAYFQGILREKKRFEKDYQIVRPSDGAERWVSGKGELILDAQSRPIEMIGTIQDITEHRQAEAALEESELRYRQLFERSESALAVHEMMLDSRGKPLDYRFVDVNPAFERMTGLRGSEIVGRTALHVLPDLEPHWIELYGRVAATGESATFELYTRALGRHYAGSAYSPRANQFAVSFTDVTERKKAEEEVRLLNVELEQRVRSRTAALEAANRELEAFAHSVSHDLRAPLRGIDGWSLALLEDFGETLDPKGRKYLDRVRSEAQHMGRLIDDLLHLSRVGRTELVFSSVDLTSVAESIVGRLKDANPGRSIEFIVAPGLKCTGDARLLEIALTNLLANAVKFTGLVREARVEFGQLAYENTPAFFVRDNGVGFDMAYAGMLFGPFQRLHKASEFPGTGIGLATVQRVINRHGGCIWAEARVGVGATFYFTLGADKS